MRAAGHEHEQAALLAEMWALDLEIKVRILWRRHQGTVTWV